MREFKVPEKNSDFCNLLWFAQDHIMKWYEIKSPLSYGAVRATGKFDGNFDYSVGLMLMTICVSYEPRSNGKGKGITMFYTTRIIITNIDDGVWDAVSQEFTNKEECEALTEKVYRAYVEYENKNWGSVLPTEKELNEFLMPFGIWGEFTG